MSHGAILPHYVNGIARKGLTNGGAVIVKGKTAISHFRAPYGENGKSSENAHTQTILTLHGAAQA